MNGKKVEEKTGKKFNYPVATIRIRKFGIWKKTKFFTLIKDKIKYQIEISQGQGKICFCCKKAEVWKRIRETMFL